MNASELPAVANFEEVEGYFSEVGISEDILIRAIRAGLRERNRVTKLHPVTAAGSRTWEDIIAEMRAGLLELEGSNWNYSHEKGLSLTHNKDAAITIVVSSGNKFTGIKEEKEKVKTKNAKGPSTLHYVGRNYTLFDDLENTDTNIQNIIANPNQTWVFLYHVDITAKEVRYELSLPKGMHEAEGKLKIDEWIKRVTFNPVPFSSPFDGLEKPDFSEEINFTDIAKE